MAASSQHLATLAGYKALSKGGNAVDAAVAMVSTLRCRRTLFRRHWRRCLRPPLSGQREKADRDERERQGPYRANAKWFEEKGMRDIPERGILPVTIPGALQGGPRLFAATEGLPSGCVRRCDLLRGTGLSVTEVISGEWKNSEAVLLSHESAAKAYLVDGKAPRPGRSFSTRIWRGPTKRLCVKG